MTDPIVVIGAAGWIGAAVTEAARRIGPVLAVTRAGGADTHALDPTDVDAVGAFLDAHHPRAVINAAGLLNGDDDALHEHNVVVVQRLLAATTTRGIAFVTVGSAAEYGDPGEVERLGEDATENPSSAYARSKLAATDAVRAARGTGASAVTARLFNVAGPRVSPDRPLGDLVVRVHALPSHGGVLVVDDATVERDWVTLDFVAGALVGLALAPAPTGHDVVNVCTGEPTTMGALSLALAHALGRAPELEDGAAGRGPRRVVGDPTRLRAVIGLRAQFTADELAAATIAELPPAANPQIT